MNKRRSILPAARPDWAFFLDVDGTLIEFADSPGAVHVDDALLGLVARLHRTCGGALALISGRCLTDLEQRLGSVRIPLAGQHGLERRDAGGRRHAHATPAAQKRELRQRLDSLVAQHPGLLLEDKGLTLALHYRQAPQLAAWLHRLLGRLIEQTEGLQLQKGKRVLEIKPAGFDKGSAIAEFMAEAPFHGRIPVFIGDDVTDEDGFARVNLLGGHSIKVGAGMTAARYRLADVPSVRDWLAGAIVEQGDIA
ncbi:MAG: trehalose-phosphatase [Betaproteobacteria bacterium HGW-Betaproteobacteria-11]|nr:MAG: trehalose-phosphatase [Betaproteobacteria bacterium HGW-Betaproteobacteria-11]